MSTSHALLDLVEEITSSIDAKKISIGVFIDLKKAFDTVNHDLLIGKLEYYGIRGIAQEWLKSYLKDRKQFVQIDECASTLLSVTCRVPQGSILGPKLFILYINDICNASTILKFILFADDTNVFYSGVDIQTLCECISRELGKLHVWLSVNKLSLNVDKTNCILFGNHKNIDNVRISMNNSIITRVRATKLTPTSLCDYVLEHDLDIVCVTDRWVTLRDANSCTSTIPGYTLEHIPRCNRSGGGVGVLFKDGLRLASSKPWLADSFECVEVVLCGLTASSELRLFVIYRPPSSGRYARPFSTFLLEFRDLVAYACMQ